MKTVYCPVKEGQINGDDCYRLCAIADEEITSRVLPDGVEYWNNEQQEKCLKCKYHYPIEDDEI